MKLNISRWAFVLLLLTPTAASAAEGGQQGPLDVNVALIAWTALIFLLTLFVLGKFAWPHILGAVEQREQRIRDLLEQSERDRAEAARLLEEQQRELEALRERAQETIAEARTGAERVREQMLAEARAEQDAMLARAERDVQAQLETALATVRAEAVELAIAAAEKLIHQNLDDAANRQLVQQFLADVDARDAAGDAVAAGV